MRNACVRLAVVALALIVFAPLASAQTPAGVAGSWKVSLQSDQGPSEAGLVLKQEGSKVVGEITSDLGTAPLDGTFADGKLKLVMNSDACGQSLVITFNAVLEKDTLKGDLDLGGLGTATWTATRTKSESRHYLDRDDEADLEVSNRALDVLVPMHGVGRNQDHIALGHPPDDAALHVGRTACGRTHDRAAVAGVPAPSMM